MILTILKYLGLCLAAISSIWGITHELTIKTTDNRKRLTRAGIVSILFVVIGLVLSMVSDSIGRRNAEQEQYTKAAAEAKHQNEIIVALQPLTSLNFLLQFESSDTSFRKKMEDGDRDIQENEMSEQGGVPRVPYDAKEYKSGLIPMLKFLGQLGDNNQKQSAESKDKGKDDSPDSNGVVALLPLDDVPNSILSFGEVNNQIVWNDESAHKLSAGLSLLQTGITYPVTTKQFLVDSPSKYAIQWNLDPVTLENSVDRANTAIRLGTKLPQVLKLVILRVAETLPFAHNNFASTSSGLWNVDPNEVKHAISNVSNMTLTATVNGFSDLQYHYKLASVNQKPLYNDFGEEIEIGCTIFEFKLD